MYKQNIKEKVKERYGKIALLGKLILVVHLKSVVRLMMIIILKMIRIGLHRLYNLQK